MSALSQHALKRFRTPFRLGSTSYVYPADIVPNVERLAAQGDVDDIELVLFEVDDGQNNLPDEQVIQRLVELGAHHGITYTVHLPLDLLLGTQTDAQQRSLAKAERVIKTTLPLDPFAYTFHLLPTENEQVLHLPDALQALEKLIGWVEKPELLAVENLEGFAPTFLDPVLAAAPISRTTDIGHLWKMGYDPLLFLPDWLPRTRVIHLHGLAERDHKSLAHMSPAQVDPVVAALMNYHGVLSLEVFGEDDFFSSRQTLLDSFARVSYA